MAKKDKTLKKKSAKRKKSAEAASPAKKAKKAKKKVDPVKKLRKVFKAAQKEWRADKKNKALKKTMRAAKAAWQEAQAAAEGGAPAKAEEVKEEEAAPMEEEAKEEEAAPAPAPAPAADDGCTTIFCGNLPWSVDEDTVKEVFKACGEVTNIRWGQDRETGDFKGYAHIDFATSEACAKAIAMNGQDCGGREMRIDASKPRSGGDKKGGRGGGAPFAGPGEVPANPDATPRCFIGNLSYKIDEDGLKNAFKEKGLTIVDVFFLTDKETGDFYGSSFCEFASPDEAAKACSYAGLPVMGRPIRVDFAKPRNNSGGGGGGKGKREARPPSERPEGGTNTAFFGNLSFDIDDDGMKKWCGEQGANDVESIRWLTHKDSGDFKGCGFVQFASVESVDKCVAKSGTDILGRSARIDFANS